MGDILRRYQPTRLEDLTALNALYRPGPIQGGMIDDFINRKQGKKKVSYDLPELKEILEETYGVILYQEQVMQIANRLAGFSLGEAGGLGITVLPPDVNSSDLDFTPVGESIRFGLQAIKNVGENTAKGILEARAELGRFHSIYQFVDNIDTRLLNKRVLESLIKSGAMDTLGARRAQNFAVIDRAIERAQRQQRERTRCQTRLFRRPEAPAA